MKLQRVTITGADESVRISDLRQMSRRYPFVEWGILVSRSNTAASAGSPRWPGLPWVKSLQQAQAKDGMHLALHICGGWVRDILLGELSMPRHLLDGFDRVQLNFHGEPLRHVPELFPAAIAALGRRQVIFQVDGANGLERLRDIWKADKDGDVDAVPLYDLSHGAGKVPTAWPSPIAPDIMQGYAGGLGPDNVIRELDRIATVTRGDHRIWIDMETNVRSNRDTIFDMGKVVEVLMHMELFVR